jgi:transcription antitermination factor NusB
VKKRTRARELVLQALYQLDLQGTDFAPELGPFINAEEKDKDTAKFAKEIVRGVVLEIEAIDQMIREVAQNWDIERMAVIDRNILRMATHEILNMDDIPPKVSINEAIELGKRFSTKNSGAFINGILDRIKTKGAEMKAAELKAEEEDEDEEVAVAEEVAVVEEVAEEVDEETGQ